LVALAGLVLLVPLGVVTATSTCPAVWGGLVAVISVEESTAKCKAAADPNCTAVASERFAPLIVTVVPPAVLPAAGLTAAMVGTGGGGAT
jgi:hypothetical protein